MIGQIKVQCEIQLYSKFFVQNNDDDDDQVLVWGYKRQY